MIIRCPECGGTEFEQISPGYFWCQSSRRDSPRGPQDVFDNRRCGTSFRAGEPSFAEQDRERRHRVEQDKSARITAEFRAATSQALMDCETLRALRMILLTSPKHAQMPDCRATWQRLIGTGEVQATHQLVRAEGYATTAGAILRQVTRTQRGVWSESSDPREDLWLAPKAGRIFHSTRPGDPDLDVWLDAAGCVWLRGDTDIRLACSHDVTRESPAISQFVLPHGRPLTLSRGRNDGYIYHRVVDAIQLSLHQHRGGSEHDDPEYARVAAVAFSR